MTAVGPSALSIAPSQAWQGNDGPWSTFTLGFGSPPQYLGLLISTTAPQPWVVLPQGCPAQNLNSCGPARGNLFAVNGSTTWQNLGLFTLESEDNLYNDHNNGLFGLDNLLLGVPGSSAPTVDSQILAGIATPDFWIATLGIRPAHTNLTTLNNQYPSLLLTLKQKGQLSSLSWGYTAGDYSRSLVIKQALGSLTLGGYDASLFVPSNISFGFAPDTSRDLSIGVQSITVHGLNSSTSPFNLLSAPVLSFIDAGVSQIWLDTASCQLFEQAFGIRYDPILQLYPLNETHHNALLSQNASISFKIGSDTTSTQTVDIVFPYANFDLQLTTDYRGVMNETRYFPLRRAANNTQYTLGRAFLQQAYIIADYERSNFSINPRIWSDTAKQDIRVIPPMGQPSDATNTTIPRSQQSAFTSGEDAGIAIGTVAAISIICIGMFVAYRRRKKQRKIFPPELQSDPVEVENFEELDAGHEAQKIELAANQIPKLELATDGVRHEMQGSATVHELESTL